MKNKSINNKGFSLIELIVAVLIMGIISGAAIVAFSSIFAVDAKGAAKKLVDAMKQTRVDAFGMENKTLADGTSYIYARLYENNSEVMVDICSSKTGNYDESSRELIHQQKIGGAGVSLEFYTVHIPEDEDDEYKENLKATIVEDGSDEVYVHFNQATGAVGKIWLYDGSEKTTTTTEPILMKIKKTSGDSAEVVLVDVTGRCYVSE